MLGNFLNLSNFYTLIMAAQKLYTYTEIFTIIDKTNSPDQMTNLIDHLMFNAVQYISSCGAAKYNSIAFTIQEKLRQLEAIAL